MTIENFADSGHVVPDPRPVQRFAAEPMGGWAKRLFDVIFALLALLTFGSLMIVIAIALKVISGGPVFYVQNRVGLGGKLFPCLKFRTMVVDADARLKRILETDREAAAEFAAVHKLKCDPRVIRGIGAFLRKTSLDELPQFVNVLLGHMSTVGPRPVTKEEWLAYYGPDHPYTLARPGITGVWQTSGRNTLDIATRATIDAHYIANWRASDDLGIILKTALIVCIYRDGY